MTWLFQLDAGMFTLSDADILIAMIIFIMNWGHWLVLAVTIFSACKTIRHGAAEARTSWRVVCSHGGDAPSASFGPASWS